MSSDVSASMDLDTPELHEEPKEEPQEERREEPQEEPQALVRCETCDELLLPSSLADHVAACNVYQEMLAKQLDAQAAYKAYHKRHQERVIIGSILDSQNNLDQYKGRVEPGSPDSPPADIWQPGVIVDMAVDLEGDERGYRRPWMVLAMDWEEESMLVAPMFTRKSRGLYGCFADEWHFYMPLGFTRHTIGQVAHTSEYRKYQRQWRTDQAWPDHDEHGKSAYAPLILEYAYASAYDATSMLDARCAKSVYLEQIERPKAVRRIGYEDFRRVMRVVERYTGRRVRLTREPWL